MKITDNHLTAEAGKALHCLWDGKMYGREVWLGYSYFKNGRKLKKPRLLKAENFEEVEDPLIATITLQSLGLDEGCGYSEVKAAVVKMCYSIDDQMALMLNRIKQPEKYDEAYRKMEEWRDFASVVAERLTGKEVNNDNL